MSAEDGALYDGDEEEEAGNLIAAEVPPTQNVRHTRACLVCRLVKTYEQFFTNGCENCPFLEMAGQQDRVSDCTTPHFDGFCAIVHPSESWCAKWQREDKYRPGVYCVTMTGELPEYVRNFMDDQGLQYLSAR